MLHLLCSLLQPLEPNMGQMSLSNSTETWYLNVWQNTNSPVLKAGSGITERVFLQLRVYGVQLSSLGSSHSKTYHYALLRVQ